MNSIDVIEPAPSSVLPSTESKTKQESSMMMTTQESSWGCDENENTVPVVSSSATSSCCCCNDECCCIKMWNYDGILEARGYALLAMGRGVAVMSNSKHVLFFV